MKMRHKKMARCAFRHVPTQHKWTDTGWSWNPNFWVIARWERQFKGMH